MVLKKRRKWKNSHLQEHGTEEYDNRRGGGEGEEKD